MLRQQQKNLHTFDAIMELDLCRIPHAFGKQVM